MAPGSTVSAGVAGTGMPPAATRADLAFGWLVQVYTPTWLAAAHLGSDATRLRELDLGDDAALKEAVAVARDVRDVAEATADYDLSAQTAVQTAVQRAIDRTPAAEAVAAVWADVTRRDSLAWDVWENLGDAAYAAATAVAGAAVADDPDNAELAAGAVLAVVVADLRQSAQTAGVTR